MSLVKKYNQIKVYLLFIAVFIFLNITNTFFLTVIHLNRYIAPFEHTVLGNINAFFGNFSVLFFFMLLLFLITKNAKKRMQLLLGFTFILNFLIYTFGLFNLFFGSTFSRTTFIIFKNPAPGIAGGILVQMFLELFTYYRIVVFLPFIILLIIYLLSDRHILKQTLIPFQIKRHFIGGIAAVLILLVTISAYGRQFINTLPVQSVKSTYAIQNLGVYPYYLGQLFGYQFDVDIRGLLGIDSDDDLVDAVQAYNKNKTSYTNFFNGQTYSNRLTTEQAVNSLFIDPALSSDNNLHGILEGRNLVLIHLESFNYFLLEIEQTNQRLPFLNQLLSESFVFSEFYNNVGMGVSSDAEFSVLTGLYPKGDETIFWEFEHKPYDLKSLTKYFNEEGYYTKAIHGDTEIFYNRRQVYRDMFEFDEFYALEDFIEDGYDVEGGYLYDSESQKIHHSPWISDFHLADMVFEVGDALIQNNQPFMLFPVAMMPHTPFDYDPNGAREDLYPEWMDDISHLTLKYLNYVDYYDDSIKRFFVDEFNDNQTLENTVYLFYSDHGSGLKNGDLDVLYNRSLETMETRRILQETLAFIYVPGDQVIDYGDYQINVGLLKGEQSLVRSQVDLYRTVVELFNLPAGHDVYFGVHGLSHEPTFAMDNRLLDIVFDDYIFSMRNPYYIFPNSYTVDKEIYQYILEFKLLGDLMLRRADLIKMIDEAVADLNT